MRKKLALAAVVAVGFFAGLTGAAAADGAEPIKIEMSQCFGLVAAELEYDPQTGEVHFTGLSFDFYGVAPCLN